VSALDAFWTVHTALLGLERELNAGETDPIMQAVGLPYPTTVGIVRGGVWASNVMELLTAEIRVGVAIDETIAEAEVRFEKTLSEAIAGDAWLDANPPRVVRSGAAFGSSRIDPSDPLVAMVRAEAEAALGTEPSLIGVPYGCDMAMWIREGEAATLVYGPGDVAHAHAADERVSITEAASVAEVLVGVAGRSQR
jgi:acetylornithine deacetylase